jgi:amino acid permease
MNGTLLFMCLGSIIIYFNLFGSISSGLIKNVTGRNGSDSFFLSSQFYIMLMAAANLVPIYMRAIKELKIVSILLFTSIISFTVFIIVYLCY